MNCLIFGKIQNSDATDNKAMQLSPFVSITFYFIIFLVAQYMQGRLSKGDD